ncbi:LLM class flavin-dependent oxidoreductase [Actinocrispum wychmicini]|uniref:Alkanesulfonate monooxygenase SsuD/methylene tetrahydromethanopterin reductase-like flavin-dependent oxidoreductase (Luciferase family) n=1 Tax=Actinocrispum wychmicini TaxID=1213861 RepID=A0A4R2IK73_9PSEU|nr:LLM class flavin-dependent oxidoreductase [Actinocrispum wychmicini]TCO44259.1 alkanesulfonate monooxygenase SsuD/methylene tetrahydromethanopterin reductase-like flavin-dependent oxidoreductase (luciferase family) [Actinocrispum wychmicini]
MKIGIGLPNQVRDVRADVIPAWAKKAEEAGFASLGTIGRIAYPGVMDTVALAAAAGATSTIGLVSTVMLTPVWPSTLIGKELAGIQGVSGGRLTVGIGVGGRPDDFVVDGLGEKGTGKRLNSAVEEWRGLWSGEKVHGGDNVGVPGGSIDVPLLFGGFVPAAMDRIAKYGQGHVSPAMPPEQLSQIFGGVRAAWQEHGREGSPRFVVISYFGLTDLEKGQDNERHYYAFGGPEYAEQVAGGILGSADALKATLKAYEGIGTDELILHPSTDNLDEIARLADIVL